MSTLRKYVVWIAAVAAIVRSGCQLPADWPISQPEPGGTLDLTLTWSSGSCRSSSCSPSLHGPEGSGGDRGRGGGTRLRATSSPTPALASSGCRSAFPGLSWFEAGFHKFQGPGWLDGGAALRGFWTGAVSIPDTGHPPISYDWYGTSSTSC